MPKMNISKSIKIDASAEKIFSVISDFNKWRPWSPWLVTEPETQVTISADAKSYEWQGKRTGEGNMKILKEEATKSLDVDLNFIKPWKSQADVRFELTEEGGTTTVTWLMDSSLPFFLFFMKKMMVAMIGADYDRGLDMLKSYVETGSVPSTLGFLGNSSFEGCKYVGIERECSMDEMASNMQIDFEKLMEFRATNSDKISGDPFSIYHKWEFAKRRVSYTSGFPVSEFPADLSTDFITGEIPATQIRTVRHTGPYRFMGNAWATLYGMKQAKEFKHNKPIAPFEIYRNNPTEVLEGELITDVNFPVK